MAVYPTSIKTYTTKENKVDVYDASHINDLQTEVVALQTYVGTNPHGDRASVSERLNAMLNPSGYLITSAGTPQPTAPGMIWADSAAGVLKYILSDGTQQTVGQNFSNVIYRDSFGSLVVATDYNADVGFVTNQATLNATDPPPLAAWNYYVKSTDTNWVQIRPSILWTKISGVNTLKAYPTWWAAGDGQWSQLSFGIGATTSASATYASTTPHLEEISLDVSGVANGTVYEIDFYVRRQTSGNSTGVGHVVILGE